jgi:hypothetical protein
MLTEAQFQGVALMVTREPGVTVKEAVVGNHHKSSAGNTFSHDVGKSQYEGVSEIRIKAGTDTAYLPYYQDKISSIVLPDTGPSVFVTDNMSGCCLYIDRQANGQLVVFHANSQLGSSQAVMAGKPPSYQTESATKALDALVQAARRDHANLTSIGILSKSRYLSKVDKLAKTADDFLGGTTIVAFRKGKNWEFWYQNFGSIKGGKAALLHAEKFFP